MIASKINVRRLTFDLKRGEAKVTVRRETMRRTESYQEVCLNVL